MTDFIFQHGAMMGCWVWDELIEELKARAPDNRYAAFDVPGCGSKRSIDTRELTFDDVVASVLADLDASGMEDIVLVGHSQGGTLITRLAEERPAKIRKLVYIASLAPDPGQSVMEAAEADNDGEEVKATNMIEGIRNMLCNDMDVPMTREFLSKLGGGDAWPPHSYTVKGWRYDHLGNVPVTYVFCEQDNCVPPAKQEAYLANLGADKVIRIDSGHQPMNSRPGELADMLLAEASA